MIISDYSDDYVFRVVIYFVEVGLVVLIGIKFKKIVVKDDVYVVFLEIVLKCYMKVGHFG